MKLIIFEENKRLIVRQPIEFVENAIAALPEGIEYQVIDSEDLPPIETRDRWRLTPNGIEVGESPAVPSWEGFILGFAECLDCFASLVPNQDARTLIVAAINNASQNPQSAAVHLGQAQAYWNRFAVAEPGAIAALNALCQSNHMSFALNTDGHLIVVGD